MFCLPSVKSNVSVWRNKDWNESKGYEKQIKRVLREIQISTRCNYLCISEQLSSVLLCCNSPRMTHSATAVFPRKMSLKMNILLWWWCFHAVKLSLRQVAGVPADLAPVHLCNRTSCVTDINRHTSTSSQPLSPPMCWVGVGVSSSISLFALSGWSSGQNEQLSLWRRSSSIPWRSLNCVLELQHAWEIQGWV